MERDRIIGNNWGATRLIFEDAPRAQQDVSLIIDAVGTDDAFTGRFKASEDQLIDGRFIQDGLRPRIVYTRRNQAGNVVTRYSGRVIELDGDTTVMIRGQFTRATTNADGSITIASGDHETEKPT